MADGRCPDCGFDAELHCKCEPRPDVEPDVRKAIADARAALERAGAKRT